MKRFFCIVFFSLAFFLIGCDRPQNSVVIYTSVDQPVAEPILRDFEKQTGIRVIVQTDGEATKTTGLVERLRAERSNPQADVWWNNEIFHTINLANEGVLVPYLSPAAADIPAQFQDPDHRWTAIALRIRVLGISTDPHAAPAAQVRTLTDLLNPALKGKIAICNPAWGTAAGHVASLYLLWGNEKADRYFRDLKANGVHVLGGNSVVAQYIANGQIWAGLTDNDDIDSALETGGKIRLQLPDQSPNEIGTLGLPCAVSLVAGAKHPAAAQQLIDYLLSTKVESRMIAAHYARYSVRNTHATNSEVKLMKVNYADVARVLPQAMKSATEILEGR